MDEQPSPGPSVPPPGAPEIDPSFGAKPPRSDAPKIHAAHSAIVPLDTDDTRGQHFRSLVGSIVFASIVATVAILGFVVGVTAAESVGIGAAIAGGVLIVALLIAFLIASSRAKEDFFETYASRRDLVRIGSGDLPPVTKLLRRGDRRRAEQIMTGELPGGLTGTIAHYTYEIETTDSDGDRDTQRYPFTVCIANIPEAAIPVTDVTCQRRVGFRFLDSAEDKFRRSRRLELESEAFDKTYELFFNPADSENWMKQLFIPSFIVWMAEQAPKDFAFELSAGALCAYVKGHRNDAHGLDDVARAASVVAERIRSEASEPPVGG